MRKRFDRAVWPTVIGLALSVAGCGSSTILTDENDPLPQLYGNRDAEVSGGAPGSGTGMGGGMGGGMGRGAGGKRHGTGGGVGDGGGKMDGTGGGKMKYKNAPKTGDSPADKSATEKTAEPKTGSEKAQPESPNE